MIDLAALVRAGVAVVLFAGPALSEPVAKVAVGGATSTTLVSTGETVLGQPIAYPAGGAKLTAVMIELAPGAETGWHRHDVPMVFHVTAGEITVDYGERGRKVYRAGDSGVEAIGVAHNGTSTGAETARLIAVFVGSDGTRPTTMLPGRP